MLLKNEPEQNKNPSHFDGKRFFNPTLPDFNRDFFESLRMWITTPKAVWPKYVVNTASPHLHEKLSSTQAAFTFVNHATFLIQVDGLNILTDPIWSNRASPFSWLGPKRVRAPGVDLAAIDKIDLVLISHNHYDHLDLPTLQQLKQRFNPTILVPLGDKKLLDSKGFKKVIELDWWQEYVINNNTKIIFTPTQHFSARTLFDKCLSLWGSYVIQSIHKQIYFGGDAGYSTHYVDIYRKFGAMDVALLGIGAYEPGWFMHPMHNNPDEAVLAHLDLHAIKSIAMHYGTFQLSAEGIDEPLKDLAIACKNRGIGSNEFISMKEGETLVYNAEKG